MSSAGNIFIKSIDLSNIPIGCRICSFASVDCGANAFIYVGFKPATSIEGSSRCHIYVYGMSRIDELTYLQDLKLGYKPIEMHTLTQGGRQLLFVLGSDKDIHVYEIDGLKGKLFRSLHAEAVKEFWSSRLGLGASFGLRFITEEWNGGGQCVVGYADGYLYWSRTLQFGLETLSPFGGEIENPNDQNDFARPPSCSEFHCAVLLDSAITSLAFYDFQYYKEQRKNAFLARLGLKSTNPPSPIVIVGLANGAVIMISSTTGSAERVVLSGLEPSSHGAVMTICVGDVTCAGASNVIVGYYDGWIAVYSVHSEYFATVDSAGSFNRLSSEDGSELGRPLQQSTEESTPSALQVELSVILPFPVTYLKLGSYISACDVDEASADDPNEGSEAAAAGDAAKGARRFCIFGEVLVAVSTHGVHMFTYRYVRICVVFISKVGIVSNWLLYVAKIT